jgi:hypothetical protein
LLQVIRHKGARDRIQWFSDCLLRMENIPLQHPFIRCGEFHSFFLVSSI